LAATLETGRVHAQGTGFSFLGALVRIITPNGDFKNDVAILCIENPKSSEVTGTVYDLRGGNVSGMLRETSGVVNTPSKTCQDTHGGSTYIEAVTWNGRMNGSAVASGVYIYRIQSEDATVTGTVVVAR
ncbi:MAG TPA: hypothetical protein DCM05_14580, partial [Elusimicrobia bacterium]|nr:hypothetical protein [Elusimicrobiota bacterium]